MSSYPPAASPKANQGQAPRALRPAPRVDLASLDAMPDMSGVRGGASTTARQMAPAPAAPAGTTVELSQPYPGLVSASLASPFDQDATLASLKRNERPYLQTAEPEAKPFSVETLKSQAEGGPGGLMISGGGQTREQSARESALMAGQIQDSEDKQQRVAQAMAADEAERQAAIQQRYAADKAAKEAAFYQRYGIPPTKESIEAMAKFEAEASAVERNVASLAEAEKMGEVEAEKLEQELERMAVPEPDRKQARALLKAKWDRRRLERLFAASIGGKSASPAGLRPQPENEDPLTLRP